MKGKLFVIAPLMFVLGSHPAYGAFNHKVVSGYTLEGKHAKIKCDTCHLEGKNYKGTPVDCLSCHKNKSHRNKTYGRNCESCHTAVSWRNVSMDMSRHTFPIRHRGARDCRDCHPKTMKEYTCYQCHKHRPSKIERKHLKHGIRNYDNCMKCHPTGREHEGRGRDGDRRGRYENKGRSNRWWRFWDRHDDDHENHRRHDDDDDDHENHRRHDDDD